MGLWVRALAVLALCGVFAAAKDIKNCTEVEKGSFGCYTCYDLDGGSCDWGLSCCEGACWKLHDADSSTVAKGCRKSKQSATSANYDTGIEIEGNKLEGNAFYCTGDLCNAGIAQSASLLLSLLSALLPALLLLPQLHH